MIARRPRLEPGIKWLVPRRMVLSKRMAEAFRAAGGNVEYHLLSDFGGDGHFLMDSADAVQLWAPIVSEFLATHP